MSGDAKNLPFKNASFDAVFYTTTLEFVNNYKKTMQEAWRVKRVIGKIFGTSDRKHASLYIIFGAKRSMKLVSYIGI